MSASEAPQHFSKTLKKLTAFVISPVASITTKEDGRIICKSAPQGIRMRKNPPHGLKSKRDFSSCHGEIKNHQNNPNDLLYA